MIGINMKINVHSFYFEQLKKRKGMRIIPQMRINILFHCSQFSYDRYEIIRYY